MIACFVCDKTFKDYGRQKFCSLTCRTFWFSDKELPTIKKDKTMKLTSNEIEWQTFKNYALVFDWNNSVFSQYQDKPNNYFEAYIPAALKTLCQSIENYHARDYLPGLRKIVIKANEALRDISDKP